MTFQNITFTTFLSNLQRQIPYLSAFISALMYLVGFMFIFRSIMEMKQYGEMRTMNSSQARMKPTMVYLAIGAGLIFYPSMISTSLNTVFGSDNILGYPGGSVTKQGTLLVETVTLAFRLIGYIAFFRGWVIMTQTASQQAKQGTVGRALSHIIGGIFLINIIATWQILITFFGLGAGSGGGT